MGGGRSLRGYEGYLGVRVYVCVLCVCVGRVLLAHRVFCDEHERQRGDHMGSEAGKTVRYLRVFSVRWCLPFSLFLSSSLAAAVLIGTVDKVESNGLVTFFIFPLRLLLNILRFTIHCSCREGSHPVQGNANEIQPLAGRRDRASLILPLPVHFSHPMRRLHGEHE
ncbi:hypothetical protein LZ30DRAFT_276515 [Colletotrichum cereale]|nr:hypothetical protein LZ30DRAFT_276515 [Colletotrichum cereale]